MIDNNGISNSNGYKNRFVQYREQVEKTKNFSQELGQNIQQATQAKSLEKANSLQSTEVQKKQAEMATLKKNTEESNVNELKSNAPANPLEVASSELSPKILEYSDYIKNAAKQHNLDPALVAGFIWQESRGNSQAKSSVGAMGLMQLMPGTAAMLGVKNPWDPQQNIMGGAKYIRQMLDRFNGKIELAVAAYNAGPGNVEKFGRKIPPFKETQQYVPAVLGFASNFKASGIFDESPTTMRA